jgi:hypothetical protein
MSQPLGLHRLDELIGQPQAGRGQLMQLEQYRPLRPCVVLPARQQVRNGPKHGTDVMRLIDLRVPRHGGNVMHGKPPGNERRVQPTGQGRVTERCAVGVPALGLASPKAPAHRPP